MAAEERVTAHSQHHRLVISSLLNVSNMSCDVLTSPS